MEGCGTCGRMLAGSVNDISVSVDSVCGLYVRDGTRHAVRQVGCARRVNEGRIAIQVS